MIKFLYDSDKQLIFNYLDTDRSALLSAVTEIYPNSYIPEGVFAVEYQENRPVSLFANSESFSLLFISEKSALCELYFSLRKEVHSPCKMYAEKTDEYYLLKRTCTAALTESEHNYEKFRQIIELNSSDETVNLQYLFKKGQLLPYTVGEFGGGFIINSEDYSVISHVFVKEELRGNGYGREIVEGLLNRSSSENVYLISEKNNLKFYEALGFAPVLTVNKYRR